MDRLSADQYRNQLTSLAPPGKALPEQSDSNWQQLLQALAEEYSRLDSRLHELVKEGNPESTNELLTDWERLLDLPGPCDTLPETIQERRLAAHGKLIRVGGASPAYFHRAGRKPRLPGNDHRIPSLQGRILSCRR